MVDIAGGIFQLLFQGTSYGLVTCLIALGYSLSYGVGKIINLSHGMYYFFTGYLVFSLYRYVGMPYLGSIIIGLITITIIGALTYVILVKPFQNNEIFIMISTFALAFLLGEIISLNEYMQPGFTLFSLPVFIEGGYFVFDTIIEYQEIIVIILSIIIITTVMLFIKYSKYGRAIRAVSQDHEAAQLMGINLNKILLITVVLSTFLAGLAAILYIPVGGMEASTGWNFLLLSMSVVILGGVGSIPGTLIGSFIVSYSTYFCQIFIDPALYNIFPLIILVAVLIIRPRGIFGKKERV
ncbi:MAG: branched-chain amino acid ABC transporter permease [Promethearchaeota archaeon]